MDTQKAHRQCWDCLKRRLVCDFTLPHCKKCLKNGRQCSGYDEKKPLQWVEPGHVLSRKRRKAPSKMKKPAKTTLSIHEWEQDFVNEEDGSENLQYLDDEYNETVTTAQHKLHSNFTGDVLEFCDRMTLKTVVTEKRQDEAHRLLRRAGNPERALMVLERLLALLEGEDIPTYNLRDDASEACEAVHYLNYRVYPQTCESDVLAPNSHNIIFPMTALHVLPPSIHHTLICLSLTHFVNSLPVSTGKRLAAGNWDKIYQHRGAAIRELTSSISKQKTRCSDATITSVMMFLAAEVQSRSQSGWRTHALGLIQLFEMRGGMMELYRTKSYLRPTISIFTVVLLQGNCQSAASAQIFTNPNVDSFLADIDEMYQELFPYGLVPPTLFQDLVRINYLRYEVSQALLNFEDVTELSMRAQEILVRTEAFDPRDWAQPGAKFDEWLTIGSIYKHAIAAYCIMSLSSLTLLPCVLVSTPMRKTLSSHGTQLLRHIKTAKSYPAFRRHLSLPLTVSGVEAIYRNESVRYWVEDALTELGQQTGASAPLKTRALLKQYWQRNEPGWEECFNQPYALLL